MGEGPASQRGEVITRQKQRVLLYPVPEESGSSMFRECRDQNYIIKRYTILILKVNETRKKMTRRLANDDFFSVLP